MCLPLSCRQHPWFTLHLPRYLAVMQADTISAATMIDEEMVREVAQLGFDRDMIIGAIKSRKQARQLSSDQVRWGLSSVAGVGDLLRDPPWRRWPHAVGPCCEHTL